MRLSTVASLLALTTLAMPAVPAAKAQPAWQSDRPTQAPGTALGMDGGAGAVLAPVEKGDLAPVMANDGSGLPYELWRGLDANGVETLISKIEIPPRSPALHALWLRLITADVTPTPGAAIDTRFTALRLEALYRSGLARLAADEIAKHAPGDDPLLNMLAARNALAASDASKACGMAKNAAAGIARMPQRLRGQAVMLMGYCAALADHKEGAGLAAELARNEGQENSPGLQALDAISVGAKPAIKISGTLSLLDYKLAERVGGIAHQAILEKGEPALLASLALDAMTPVNLGLPAAEQAAKLNALAPEMLAAIYRTNASKETADQLLSGGGEAKGAERRAALFKAAEAEQAPMKKTRLIRALIDDAGRMGLQFQITQALAPAAATLEPKPEISWFAETGIEIALAAGDYARARRWISSGNSSGRLASGLDHWMALADIADPAFDRRGESLPALERLAQLGRFKSDDLHRLATVLDALNYNVPIPLWEAASRTPQPNTGFLPETGVLSQLQDAAKKKEFGRTVLLAMQALGPNGAEGAHMIALGDSIRALSRAGLDADARRLGLEALFAAWPRTAGT